MPEGPEITYLVNNLLTKYISKKLINIKILYGRYITHGPPKNFNKFINLLPAICVNIFKKGKVIFFQFDNGWYIISKLGMSGWYYKENSKMKWYSYNAKNFIFNFNKNLIFSDYRNFGTFIFTNDIKIINNEITKLAPDILYPQLKFNDILYRIKFYQVKYKNELIENIIINQKFIISGIGNYLKSEILYKTKISPLRKISDIKINEWINIYKQARIISNKMLNILLQEDFDKYMNNMKVYHKKKDKFNNLIISHKTKTNRTTFWVPQIQK
jgi:formamidopyrimidine-DNA glycosylase